MKICCDQCGLMTWTGKLTHRKISWWYFAAKRKTSPCSLRSAHISWYYFSRLWRAYCSSVKKCSSWRKMSMSKRASSYHKWNSSAKTFEIKWLLLAILWFLYLAIKQQIVPAWILMAHVCTFDFVVLIICFDFFNKNKAEANII